MALKLKPVRDYPEQAYPRASDRLVKSFFLAATMTATSLGGCGPIGDYSSLDSGAEVHDLNETVDSPVADSPTPDKNETKPVDVDKSEANPLDVDKGEASSGVDGK